MTKTLQLNNAVCMFGKFSLVIPSKMIWHQDGKQHCLAGQIVVDKGYQWTDGVETILVELLEGISLCEMKGGGCD